MPIGDLIHIADRVFNQPLMMDACKLASVLTVLGPRMGLEPGHLPFAAALADARPDLGKGEATPRAAIPGAMATKTPYVMTDRGIAVISVAGSLVQRSAMQARPMSGLRSYNDIGEEFAMAMANPQVRGVLLDINSGGGEVAGAFELAAQIFAARGEKPVWAAADTSAFSAAYLIASAASRITLPVSGAVGSVGVIAIHRDFSEQDKMIGVKYTAIYAGERKNDLNPHEPLSKDARSILQASVDRWYDAFVERVAEGRGMTQAAVRKTEAGWYEGVGGMATKVGFADAVMPFADTLAELTEAANRPQGGIYTSPKRASVGAEETGAGASEGARSGALEPDRTEEKRMSDTGKAGAPAAAENGQGGDKVVSLDAARAEGRQEAIEQVRQINALCVLAGKPELAAGFIDKGLSVDAVQKDLLARRAQAADEPGPITGQHAGHDGRLDQAGILNMHVAAMRKAGVRIKGEARS